MIIELEYTIIAHNGLQWVDVIEEGYSYHKEFTKQFEISILDEPYSSVDAVNLAIIELAKTFKGTMERLKEIKRYSIIKRRK